MTYYPSTQDRVIDLIIIALGQARIVHDQISTTVIPSLPPQRRLFAQEVANRLSKGNFFDEAVLRDLEALIAVFEREVVDGTEMVWISDEYHSDGGHYTRHLDCRAEVLASVVNDLRDLHQTICDVFDALKAAQLFDTLMLD